MISTLDIAWAAGFIEGEGYFRCCSDKYPTIAVSQVEREPVEKLKRIFGGTISIRQNPSGLSKTPQNVWQINGNRAAGIMMTIFGLMSPKRQRKITEVLGKWKAHKNQKTMRGNVRQVCKRGHDATVHDIFRAGGVRICGICEQLSVARKRAKQSAADLG